MDFRVLGPLEIFVNGQNIVPTASKPRQVISLLLLRRNSLVQTGELIDELWEQDPPTSAMTTLQTYVYKLRRALVESGAEQILCTKPGGYLLNVPDSAIDLHRFETDANEGRTLVESGDAAQAAVVLRRALAAWRGPALVDVVQGGLLMSYVTRLEELRFRILDLRIQADLQLGRHSELISELKSLVVTHPLHEHLNASLMITLHRSGRRQEALEVYQTLRRRMIGELGLEPGQDLHKLHQSLLSDTPVRNGAEQRPTPERVVPAPRRPAPAPAAAPSAPANQRPASLVLPPAQLPIDLADFTCRSAVLSQLDTMLALRGETREARTAARLVCISGMPGVGKTVLAVHMAHLVRAHCPDGQLYADLQGSTDTPRDAAEVLHGFLRTLGVLEEHIPGGLSERCTMFRSVTAGRRLLILLDDVASLPQVRALLPGEPQCTVIVTSRRRLYGLGGVWSIDLDVLDQAEGLALLARIIGQARVDREPQAARSLVDLVDRLPLALRAVGSRLAALPGRSLSGMVEQLASPDVQLDELSVGDLDVRSAYDSSYDLLNRVEQSSFRLLGILPPGDFTAEAAAELFGWDLIMTGRMLDRFVDDHLLRAEVVHGDREELRYSFPRLAHLYARARLDSAIAQVRPTALLQLTTMA